MKTITVTIDGTKYQIVGDRDEIEIRNVAKYIDDRIVEIRKMAPSLSRLSSTVLTSVNIVDDLFKSKEKITELEATIQKLKDGYNVTTENVEKEFDVVLEKLDQSETKINELENEIKNLNQTIQDKIEENKKLESDLESAKGNQNFNQSEDDDKIPSLEARIKELEKKVIVAESMATEFQNKAYNLQLNLEEIKKKGALENA